MNRNLIPIKNGTGLVIGYSLVVLSLLAKYFQIIPIKDGVVYLTMRWFLDAGTGLNIFNVE